MVFFQFIGLLRKCVAGRVCEIRIFKNSSHTTCLDEITRATDRNPTNWKITIYGAKTYQRRAFIYVALRDSDVTANRFQKWFQVIRSTSVSASPPSTESSWLMCAATITTAASKVAAWPDLTNLANTSSLPGATRSADSSSNILAPG